MHRALGGIGGELLGLVRVACDHRQQYVEPNSYTIWEDFSIQ